MKKTENTSYVVRLLTVTFFSCLQFGAFSQGVKDNLSIPSPNSTSLGSFVDTPVSLSSGTASISIPLYQVSGKDISVPVSLSYNSSGVRPDVHPGWVGMNWSLNAGGMITRVVKGIPDETAWHNDILFSTSQNFTQDYFHGYNYWKSKLNVTNWDGETNVKALARAEDWVDTDPDEFVFNFCGHTGKFYMDDQGVFHVVGNPAIKVEIEDTLMSIAYNTYLMSPAISGQPIDAFYDSMERRIPGFKITTPDGTQYEFGLWNRQQTLANMAVEGSIDFFQEGYFGESWDTWYLIRIIAPNNTDLITFHYELGDPVASFGRSIAMNKQSGSSTPRGLFKLFGPVSAYSHSIMERWNGKIIYPMYLKRIVSRNAEVEFSRSPTTELSYDYNSIFSDLAYQTINSYSPFLYAHTARLAIAASAVDAFNGKPGVGVYARSDIELYDPITLAPKVRANVFAFLNSDLLESTANPYVTGQFTFNSIDVLEGVDFTKLVWHKLDKIQIKERASSGVVKSFDLTYNNDADERLMLMSVTETSAGKSHPPYSFEYEDYNSNYYAGAEKLPLYNSYKTDHWGFFNGLDARTGLDFNTEQTLRDFAAKKDPDPDFLYAGILNKMTLPTGGHIRYVYEPHTYTKTVTRNTTSGALGIRTETSAKIAGGLRIKEIQQVAGTGQPDMIRQYEYENGILNGEAQYYWEDYTGRFLETDATYTADRFVTNTILPVSSNSSGSHISYSTVKEIQPGNGYSLYTFSNHDTNPDQNFIVSIDPEKSPYSPFINKEAERGKLLNLKRYSQADVLLYEEANLYQSGASTLVKAVATTQIPVFEGWSVEGTSYQVLTYDDLRVQQTVTETLPGGGNLVTQNEFDYNDYDQLASRSWTDAKGTSLKTTYTYPMDYPTSNILYLRMQERNMLNNLIEEVNYRNTNEFLSSKKYNYQWWHGAGPGWVVPGQPLNGLLPIFLRSEESKLGAGPTVTDAEYLTYDNRGNVTSMKDRGGIVTSVQYYNTPGKADLIQSRTIATGTAVEQAFAYDYRPLAGVSSISDPNSKQVQYEYDDFGRLITEKNPSGGIRASYCYNYANQTASPCSALAPTGSIAAGALSLIGLSSPPLPVTLVSFEARAVERQALLNWETASEDLFERFDVERSRDGYNWELLGSVTSKGETSGRYDFIDGQPGGGESYYRLRMIDQDGTYTLSQIRSVRFGQEEKTVLYPNPVTVSDKLQLRSEFAGSITLVEIFGSDGRRVIRSEETVIDTHQLAAGLYVVQVTYRDGSVSTHRIIKN